MRQLACKDAGFRACNAVMQGKDDDEVMQQAMQHAQREHGIQNVTPEMQQQIRRQIKNG